MNEMPGWSEHAILLAIAWVEPHAFVIMGEP
jgi:hypothetical protein